MILASLRYVRPLGLVLALASVPVLVHSYIGVAAESCADPEALLSGVEATQPSASRAEFLRSEMHASAFAETLVAGSQEGSGFRSLVLRSWDPKRLYHRPAQRLLKGSVVKGTHWEGLDSDDGKLPIQVVDYEDLIISGHAPVAAYLLVYAGEPVSNPYLAQLRSSLRQLVFGKQPMPLYFVYAEPGRDPAGLMEARVKSWLVDAWHRHRRACAS